MNSPAGSRRCPIARLEPNGEQLGVTAKDNVRCCWTLSRGAGTEEVVAPPGAAAMLLQEGGRLLLEDGERLLEALDLCGAAALPLLVGPRLRDAALLDLGVVLQNGRELRVRRLAIAAVVRHCLVQALELLRHVLHVLILQGLGYLVLLRHGVILRLRVVLLGLLGRKVL